MFLMAKDMHYMLAGMPMAPEMLWGMAFEVIGLCLAMYGLTPATSNKSSSQSVTVVSESASLTLKHWWLIAAICIGLIIDVQKPATLGFVVPGMRSEYQIPNSTVAWLPFIALIGTAMGSLAWGFLADFYGRRASIFLSAIMFVGTSICGAMPSFWWNVVMCWLMGLSAGGMLPVAYALLTETMPAKHRSWILVLTGATGAVGGYYVASECSALLQSQFGWRILWFVNIPTGILLVILAFFLPESPKHLLALGRIEEAEKILRQFGGRLLTEAGMAAGLAARWRLMPVMASLTATALAWSIVNFGLLLWLPADLVAKGYTVEAVSGLLAKSALFGFGIVLLACPLYSLWSTKGTVALSALCTILGLLGILSIDWFGANIPALGVMSLLIVGACALLATLLPYSAELFPVSIRGRAMGWIAGCTKAGGILVQALALGGVAPQIGLISTGVLLLLIGAVTGLVVFGVETRGRSIDGEADIAKAVAAQAG